MASRQADRLKEVPVSAPNNTSTYNRITNHIGISVTDIEGFIAWYSKNLGFRQLGEIVPYDREVNPDHGIFIIYGKGLNKGRFGWLATGNGVGLEVFQFDDPKQEAVETPFQFHKSGIFHYAVTDPDPVGLSKKLQEAGAKSVGEPFDIWGNGEGWCIYLLDPWGNTLELLNVSFEEQALRLGGVRKFS